MLPGRGPAFIASSSFVQEARHRVWFEGLRDVAMGLLVVCVGACARAGSGRESGSAIRR